MGQAANVHRGGYYGTWPPIFPNARTRTWPRPVMKATAAANPRVAVTPIRTASSEMMFAGLRWPSRRRSRDGKRWLEVRQPEQRHLSGRQLVASCGPHDAAWCERGWIDSDEQGPIAQGVSLAHLLATRLAKADRLRGVGCVGCRLGSLLSYGHQAELGLDDDGQCAQAG